MTGVTRGPGRAGAASFSSGPPNRCEGLGRGKGIWRLERRPSPALYVWTLSLLEGFWTRRAVARLAMARAGQTYPRLSEKNVSEFIRDKRIRDYPRQMYPRFQQCI